MAKDKEVTKTVVEIVKEKIDAILAEHPNVLLNVQHTIQVTEVPKPVVS